MIILPGERIKQVTVDGLTYVNDAGEEAFIDFALCFQNWLEPQLTPEALKKFKELNYMTDEQVENFVARMRNETVVGGRDIGGYPEGKLPRITFYATPSIAFEFPTTDEFHRVRYWIKKAGWRTYDMT